MKKNYLSFVQIISTLRGEPNIIQAWRILSISLLVCDMSAIVQWFEHSLVLPFFGIEMKTDLFQSCGHC